MIKKIAGYGVITIAVVAVLSLVITASLRFRPKPVITQETFTVAPEPKQTKKIKRVEVPVKKVVALEKTAVVKKLDIPEQAVKGERKQITATASIPPYEGKTTVVSVLDTESGESEIIARQEPLPFAELKSRFQVGLNYYPFKSETLGEYALDANYTFGRISALRGQIKGEVDTKGNWKAGVRVYAEW